MAKMDREPSFVEVPAVLRVRVSGSLKGEEVKRMALSKLSAVFGQSVGVGVFVGKDVRVDLLGPVHSIEHGEMEIAR